mgnify:CR=1 FL=1
MEKNQFLITKVFTVPYFDSLVGKKRCAGFFPKMYISICERG